ncbi:ferritin-like domain-containing protein [Ramlibacter alkalitolerans]|uniref:PA2169 family four-helix-bundle protein n=1 Tax=Ramlibacter alkalitolerans TaxID=2039631 RepID=A0ABS1JIC0_9BURK|nr:PA2169 family four-helix-bundle protein [Ramlibacter alkalitolerans]MBL0423949.1 PA2169 family four-helix-bundle protein [Ramlibacter alkalitolerans]
MAAEEREDRDLNRDPITDEPGAHPVGTGLGAAGGGVAGAAAGAIAGPVGAAIGGVVGAVVGGLAGKAAGEAVNPTAEEAFWRDNYHKEPYYEQGRSFDDYGPAYRLGLSGRDRYEDSWTSVEPRLAPEWESNRGNSTLNWDRASHAAGAAYQRADEQYRNYSTGMGRAGMGTPDGGNTGLRGMGPSGTPSGTGAAGMVGSMQTAGNGDGDRGDVIDVLKDLVECSKDGEYGFRECAEQATRQDLKSMLQQRAEDCRRGADELNRLLRECGHDAEEGGSTLGAMHRGWVSIKSKLSTYDDKAVLEECERGEDNAKARYMKALQKNLPANVRTVIERQYQGVQRNHDQVKMMRDQFRSA